MLKLISDFSGFNNSKLPNNELIRHDLPLPVSPIIVINSSLLIVKFIPFNKIVFSFPFSPFIPKSQFLNSISYLL